ENRAAKRIASHAGADRYRQQRGVSPGRWRPEHHRHRHHHRCGQYRVDGVPTGIRTPLLTVKGGCPRPLDDGDNRSKQSIASRKSGGARRDRTADLLHAMQALSQLSYGPTWRRGTLPERGDFVKKMNDLRAPGGLAPGPPAEMPPPSQKGRGCVNGRGYRAAANGEADGLRQLA